MRYDGPGMQIPGGGRVAGSAGTPVTERSASSAVHQLDEVTDAMWQMHLRDNGTMAAGPYPERPGEPDCTYYIRTGLCRFGLTCKYNHPPNRQLAVAAARIKGEYPERMGQPECQYYLKTGTCKFGATCKFHHPRDKAGIAGRVQLNILGYPLRPNETECAYYLRTGQCKFGNTCKFHHPQPSNSMIPLHGSPIYPSVHSPTTPAHQSYQGNWPITRTPFVPRWQGPSSYTPLIFPQGLVQVPGWNAYTGQLGSASAPESPERAQGTGQFYGSSRQSETTSAGAHATFSSYHSGSIPVGMYTLRNGNVFPERPGEPECQFYMKTGDCKFGSVCRFHHPRERSVPIPDCMLSPLGLPLRPGEPLCVFYSRYGICKFGPNCKFDHPVPVYDLSPSSSADIPIVGRLLSSPPGVAALSLSAEGPVEAGAGKSRRSQLSDSNQLASGNGDVEEESHNTSMGAVGPISLS